MFDFIPINHYTDIFFYITLILVVTSWSTLNRIKKINFSSPKKNILVLGLILYMGLRPLSFEFMDMINYSYYFSGSSLIVGAEDNDKGFWLLMLFCQKYLNVELFFLLCAFIYVFLHFYVSKKIFKQYWYYSFLMLIASFSFWSYGVNGIRNGMAAAISLTAFGFENNKKVAIGILLLAVSIHASMILVFLAFVISLFYNKPKTYLLVWLSCIPLSLVLGSMLENFFAGFISDDRSAYLTQGNINNDNFAYTGFRWDFLIYSSSAVFTGWYFIIKKNFQDPLYHRIFNIYLTTNAFWILIIRANFSNRFAYLSWFMMGLVIVYPFLTKIQIKNQPVVLGNILLIYFAFTFLMNVILS